MYKFLVLNPATPSNCESLDFPLFRSHPHTIAPHGSIFAVVVQYQSQPIGLIAAEYSQDDRHARIYSFIVTGVGEVPVQVPKVRDRSGSGIKFNSSLLPPYLKRSRSVEEVLPWLYLKGVSTGDFNEALASLLGADAAR